MFHLILLPKSVHQAWQDSCLVYLDFCGELLIFKCIKVASSVSDSFCRVDTGSTETVCEFIATVESRLADSFLARG